MEEVALAREFQFLGTWVSRRFGFALRPSQRPSQKSAPNLPPPFKTLTGMKTILHVFPALTGTAEPKKKKKKNINNWSVNFPGRPLGWGSRVF